MANMVSCERRKRLGTGMRLRDRSSRSREGGAGGRRRGRVVRRETVGDNLCTKCQCLGSDRWEKGNIAAQSIAATHLKGRDSSTKH
jgi:hypothetical protein